LVVHAAESGHWYDSEGRPVYEVEAKNGKMRPTTLRDARKLKLYPSVTGVIGVANKPPLNFWLMRQAVLSALTHPGLTTTDEDVALIMRDAQEQGRNAAEEGTWIHAAIQEHYEGEMPPLKYQEHVLSAVDAIEQWMPDYDLGMAPEQSFAHELGFGGKTDLAGPKCIIDFKTTDKPLEELITWDEHAMQISAYRAGMGFPRARGAIVYVSRAIPGQARLIEIEEPELERGWDMFLCLLKFWQLKNNYRP